MNITLDPKDVDGLLKDLAGIKAGLQRPAVNRALNRTATTARTSLLKKAREKMPALKSKTIRERFITMTPAGERGSTAAQVNVSRKRIGLIYLGARPNTPGTRPKGGVSVQPFTRRYTIVGSFVARMPRTGHVGVFTRTGAARLPIEEAELPAIATALAPEMAGLRTAMRPLMLANLEKELDRARKRS